MKKSLFVLFIAKRKTYLTDEIQNQIEFLFVLLENKD